MQFIHDETGVTANAPIAERAGLNKSTFHVQRNKPERLPSDTVIAVCKGWGINTIEGLYAAGYVTRADIQSSRSHDSLKSLPDSQLLGTLLHRALDREADGTETTPTGNVVSLDDRRTPAAGTSGVTSAALDDINEPFAASKDGEHTTDNIYPEEP